MPKTNRGAVALRQLVNPTPKVTRTVLAAELDITPSAVSEWLRGKSRPSPDIMRLLEDRYGIPMRAWTEPSDESGTELAAVDDDSE